jgi:hypothetical protein
MKKRSWFLGLFLAILMIAGCNLTSGDLATKVTQIKDTFVKSYVVVGQTIPVLEEIEKLEYIKPEIKDKIVLVIDGLKVVYEKIGSIATFLGIDVSASKDIKDLQASIEDLKICKVN